MGGRGSVVRDEGARRAQHKCASCKAFGIRTMSGVFERCSIMGSGPAAAAVLGPQTAAGNLQQNKSHFHAAVLKPTK